jgi:hypothetical protein
MTSLLVDNAKFVAKGAEGDDDGSPSPTPCQLQCIPQQEILVKCVNNIRDNNDGDKSCLTPALSAWTTCCAAANMAEQ